MPKAANLKIKYSQALKAELDIGSLRKQLEIKAKPKVGKIATNFITAAGGEKHFSDKLWQEYNDPETSSLARQRILQMIFYAMRQDQDHYDPTMLDQFEDEELKRLLVDALAVVHGDNDGDAGDDGAAGGAADDAPEGEAGEGTPEADEIPY